MKIRILLAICLALPLLIAQSTHAQTVEFTLFGMGGEGLLTTNEVGSPTGGSGGVLSGISYDTGSQTLSIDVGWGSGNGFTDLTGPAVAMHIHGPADIFSNAGVQVPLDGLAGFSNSASNGGLNDSVVLTAGQETMLFDGNLYLNVHTSANGGGEIRGNLFAVPEPSGGLATLGFFVVGGLFTRRRR